MARVITIPIGPIFTGGSCRGIIHVVEKGDTLYLLGRRYRVSVSDIMYANPYVNIYNLQIGDELCIPVAPSEISPEMPSTRPSEQPSERPSMRPPEMPSDRPPMRPPEMPQERPPMRPQPRMTEER